MTFDGSDPLLEYLASLDPAPTVPDPAASDVLVLVDRKVAGMLDTKTHKDADTSTGRRVLVAAIAAAAVVVAIAIAFGLSGGDEAISPPPESPTTTAAPTPSTTAAASTVPASTPAVPSSTTEASDPTLGETEQAIVEAFLGLYADGTLADSGIGLSGPAPDAEREALRFSAALNELLTTTGCEVVNLIRCTAFASNDFLDAIGRSSRRLDFSLSFETETGDIRGVTFFEDIEPMRGEWLEFAQWVARQDEQDAVVMARFTADGEATSPLYTVESAAMGLEYLDAYVASRG